MINKSKSIVLFLQKSFFRLFLLSFFVTFAVAINNCASSDPKTEVNNETTDREQIQNKDGGIVQDHKNQPDQKTMDTKITKDTASPAIGPVTDKELRDVVSFLASDELKGRYPGSPGGLKARDYIVERLKSCGVQPLVKSGFLQNVPSVKGANILGKVEGTDPTLKGRHILLSAHYDHLGQKGSAIYNGANDNASAVASILAVICRIAKKPLKRTVFFASWDSEEPPNFLKPSMGSLHYIKYPTIPLNKIDVAIVLDLIGDDMWQGATPHIVMGAELSTQVTKVVQRTPVPSGLHVMHAGLHLAEKTPFGLQPWSDYHGFRQNSVPVIFLSNGQNKRYHTPQDTTDKVNFKKLVLQTEYLYSMIKEFGDATETPVFNANGTNYKSDALAMYKLLEEALSSNGIVKHVGLSSQSQQKIQRDFNNVKAIKAKLEQGGTPSSSEISQLRSAAQRILCYCGNSYPESTCNMLP